MTLGQGHPTPNSFDQSFWLRLASSPVKLSIAALVIMSEIFRPLYRSVVLRLSELPGFQRLDAFVARSPRILVLFMLVVPFAIAEPLKMFALVLLAQHRVAGGVGLTILAHFISFVIVERIFHAGRQQLMTFRWLSWIINRIGEARASMANACLRLGLAFRTWLRAFDKRG